MVVVSPARLRALVVGIIAMAGYWLLNGEILQRRLSGNAFPFFVAVAGFVLLTALFAANRRLAVLLAWGVLAPLVSGPIGYLAAEVAFFFAHGNFGSQAPEFSWVVIAFVFPFVACKLWTLSILLPALIALSEATQSLVARLRGHTKRPSGQ
jgi:hypothetical protein